MTQSKFPPFQELRNIMKTEAARLSAFKVHSMWTFDEDAHIIRVYTDRPGVWIGMAGQNAARIQQLLDNAIVKHNDLMEQAGIDDRVAGMKLIINECDY